MRWPWSTSGKPSSDRATDCPAAHRYPTGTRPVRSDAKPRRTDAHAMTSRHRTDLQWHPPAEHAALLLKSLQGPDGKTGWIAAQELRDIHQELMIDLQWEPIAWDAVGRELRKLLGQRKAYVWRHGKKVRAYLIPVARTESATVPGREMRRAS